MMQASTRRAIEGLFRQNKLLNEETCSIKWSLAKRQLIFEARKAPGGVAVEFGKAFLSHPDAIERSYIAALMIRQNRTAAVRWNQHDTGGENA